MLPYIWLEFLFLVIVIGISGYYLSIYADIIADRTGFSKGWIGLILLGSITSLPELFTGASSVLLTDTIDIALGDALGSCLFNLLIIVILDFLCRKESVYTIAKQGHILSAGFGIILIGIAGFNILFYQHTPAPSIGHVGIYTPIIIILYFIAMRTIFRYEREYKIEHAEAVAVEYERVEMRKILIKFSLAATFSIVSGLRMPFVGKAISEVMGWDQTFIGSLFIAFATSLPEIAVTVSSLGIGALDMGIGNLFGSNLFDMSIIAIDDLLYFKGPIFSYSSPYHAITCFSGMMMTGVAIVGLLYRPKTKILKTVGWTSLFLFTIYLINTFYLFLFGNEHAWTP